MAEHEAVLGILALQGDFPTHRETFEARGRRVREVRSALDLEGLAGLVLPGGESTTMWKLLERESLREPLEACVRELLARGAPVLATCAGVILLAREVRRPEQASLGLLDVVVERNAYGRQLSSGIFGVRGVGDMPGGPGTFIRAPRILEVGPGVEVLGYRDEDPVLVRQGSLWAATFHPEMDREHPLLDRFEAQLSGPVPASPA